MKKTKDANKNKALTAAVGILELGSEVDTDELSIQIPPRLYALSSCPNNGYEDLLEGQKIIIKAKPILKEKKVSLIIVISQEQNNTDAVLKLLKEKGSRPRNLSNNDKILHLNYLLARELLFELVHYLQPFFLNLITK